MLKLCQKFIVALCTGAAKRIKGDLGGSTEDLSERGGSGSGTMRRWIRGGLGGHWWCVGQTDMARRRESDRNIADMDGVVIGTLIHYSWACHQVFIIPSIWHALMLTSFLSLSLGYGVGHLLAHTVIDCMTHGSPSILFYYYCSYWDLNFLLKLYTTHPCVRCL